MTNQNNSSTPSAETARLKQFDAWVESWPSVRGRALTPTEQRVAYIAWFESTARQPSERAQGGLTESEALRIAKAVAFELRKVARETAVNSKAVQVALSAVDLPAILARQPAPTQAEPCKRCGGEDMIYIEDVLRPCPDCQDLSDYDNDVAAAPQEPVVPRAVVPEGLRHNPLPWRVTSPDERKGREIVCARGATVAKLTALDLANAELIVSSVNRAAPVVQEDPIGEFQAAARQAKLEEAVAGWRGAQEGKALDGMDYSLKKGEVVYNKNWGDGKSPLEIVDTNWALRAVAVKLAPQGGIVVWPVAGLSREPFEQDSSQVDAKGGGSK